MLTIPEVFSVIKLFTFFALHLDHFALNLQVSIELTSVYIYLAFRTLDDLFRTLVKYVVLEILNGVLLGS